MLFSCFSLFLFSRILNAYELGGGGTPVAKIECPMLVVTGRQLQPKKASVGIGPGSKRVAMRKNDGHNEKLKASRW